MGWKGAVRSIGAAVRQAERDARRRQRELDRQRRDSEKLAALERAQLEVAEHENYVERLVTVHQEAASQVDWNAILSAPEPRPPDRNREAERTAREALDTYHPGRIDRLIGRQKKRLAALEEALQKAPAKDEAAHQDALRAYEENLKEWRESRDFAERVVRKESNALIEALRELNPFAEVSQLGSQLEFEAEDGLPLHATLHVHGEEVVPKTAKSFLKSGRVSEKPMPKGRYYELYQDHVCSAVLRVARDLFAILPVDTIVLTAKDKILNTQTGYLEDEAILSVLIPRRTLEGLNFHRLDPSDSMQNFVHRMSFKKTAGFSPIEPMSPKETVRGTDR